MSFNLNRLVQPECGAPNPLVAAAQQIATRSTIRLPSIRSTGPTTSAAIDFSKEFAGMTSSNRTDSFTRPKLPDQQHQQQSRMTDRNAWSSGFQQQQPMMMPTDLLLNHGLMNSSRMAGSSSINAGDQLEAKYRNDIISHTTMETAATSKLDDMEFWQSISQAYIGPSTNPLIKNKESLDEALWNNDQELGQLTLDDSEYHFDERNPFKNIVEDPFEEGLKRLAQGDIPSAALLFEASVQRQPDNSVAWRYLGTTQAQNEMDKSAIRALNNCLQLDPTDQKARLAIAVSLVNESRRREACKHLLEWLTRHDKYKTIQASLEHFQQLDQQSSDEIFQTDYSLLDKHYCYVRDKFVEAARMSPNDPDPDVQNSLGVLFNMRGEYDKAVDCFKAALSVRQDDSLLWNRLGATLANGNKSEEAVIAYRRALEISPGFLRSRYNLAISLIHFNLYDEAAKQLIQILNSQAAGKGSSDTPAIRSRSITSSSIWNTLRTVATLMNKPELYPVIDGRELTRCNEMLVTRNQDATKSN